MASFATSLRQPSTRQKIVHKSLGHIECELSPPSECCYEKKFQISTHISAAFLNFRWSWRLCCPCGCFSCKQGQKPNMHEHPSPPPPPPLPLQMRQVVSVLSKYCCKILDLEAALIHCEPSGFPHSYPSCFDRVGPATVPHTRLLQRQAGTSHPQGSRPATGWKLYLTSKCHLEMLPGRAEARL